MTAIRKITVAFLAFLALAACREKEQQGTGGWDATQELMVANELSNCHVTTLAEDAKGFIWVGTFRGLNRFDGQEYHQYFCTDDSAGLPDNQVTALLCDSRQRLWVGTANGVCIYTEQDNFNRIPVKTGKKHIVKLLEDGNGRIFAFNRDELLVYDGAQGAFVHVIGNMNQNYFGNVFAGKDGSLWAMSAQSIRCYDGKTFQRTDSVPVPGFMFYSEMMGDGTILLSGLGQAAAFNIHSRSFIDLPATVRNALTADGNVADQFVEDGQGNCLVHTLGKGFYRISRNRTAVRQEKPLPENIDLPKANVPAMLRDSRGNLWIGTADRGLLVRYSYEGRFNNDPALNHAVGQGPVTDVTTDRKGNLWIVSQDRGVLVRDTAGHVRQVKIEGLSTGQWKDVVVHLLADADGYLWAATGVELLKCRADGSLVKRFDIQGVMSMTQAKDKTVWISASETEVYCIRPGSDRAERKQVFRTYAFIPSITSQADGSMLIAGYNQKLVSLNPATMKVSEVAVPAEDWKACVRRSVFVPVDVHHDRRGGVWIGTVANGLIRMDAKTHRMEHVYGLSCSDIGSVEEDAEGNLWVATLKGLDKYDPKTRQVTAFYKFDGMGGDEFADRASCQLPDGRMFFGGTHGLTYFKPSDISVKRDIPLYFQDLRVHSQLVRPAVNGPVTKSLVNNPEVNLRYDQNSFSISFCALDYSKYPRVHYFYKLDGVDKYWLDAGTSRQGSYANLPSGHYTFHVKIVDSGNSSTLREASVPVTVMPAPWNTPWAWALYLLLVGMLATYIYGTTMRTLIARRAASEAEREKEQELRTNQMNMSFFANIAHEFRTPLTMIAGPVGQLAGNGNIGGEEKKLLSVAQRSIRRMFRLVNQLMDFNKLESDRLKLGVEPVDVARAVSDICDTFEFNAREKGLTICRRGLEETLTAWTDEDKLEKMVSNLLSNALKFTPRGGRVEVTLDACGGQVEISVADTGKGIPEEELENVFKRYYQLDNQTKGIVNWGTGIGLYFSRRLAELHHGTLKAGNREEGTGAVFTLTYPMEETAYTEEEHRHLEEGEAYSRPVENANADDGGEEEAADASEDSRPVILVVDDDVEIVNYMRLLLSRDYRVVTCLDAKSALEQMRREEPNLVLSDVSMPGMSGYELCREIKQDIQLCHIPVVLVTAKVTVDNQVEGLNVGADAYVTKPFEPPVLSALIRSQLENRDRVRRLLTNATTTEEEEVESALSDQDRQFMDELYRLMEEGLGDSELDVVKLTRLLYISRTKLYYKVKGLTGETPASFFRTYKLNRAAEFIKEGKYTVSEIADKCGFRSQSHFSIVFKKQFGVAPSQYKG